MKSSLKNLRIWSTLFVVLGIIGFVTLGIQYTTGDLMISSIMEESGASISIVSFIVYFVIILRVMISLVEIYLGMRGLQKSSGKQVGSAFIMIAYIRCTSATE